MKIRGIDGMSYEQLSSELARGARFVMFEYCVSVLVMTFKRGTDIYFVRAGESPVVKGLGWTVLSLLLGWWGFPWGLVYTPMALFTNLGGGKDVTAEVVQSLGLPMPARARAAA